MGERIRVYIVDAFTSEPLAGNAAGVVPDAEGLSAEQMRKVARELAVSETAFVLPSEPADRRLRYFSPTQEVDLCGHATVATHAYLAAEGVVDAETHTVETNAGVLDVEVDEGTVWTAQPSPRVDRTEADFDRLADALGVDSAALAAVGDDLPPAVASTGLPFLVVGVDFLESLGTADPDFGAIERLASDHDAAGVYAFTFDTLEADSTLHARCFVPGLGIDEDPVTGTASGACGAYLRYVDAFGSLPDEMRFEQGHFVDRPGVVRVQVEAAGDDATSVRVGGRGVTAIEGRVRVPEYEDDIVEA